MILYSLLIIVLMLTCPQGLFASLGAGLPRLLGRRGQAAASPTHPG
jgi:hypothetical protein